MRLEQLYYLTILEKVPSLRAASDILNISPQALGISLTKLEDELQTTLLVRSHCGTALTDKGAALAKASAQFLDEVTQILGSKKTVSPLIADHYELICSYSCMETFLPHLICDLSQSYPQLHLEALEISDIEVTSRVAQKQNEFGLLFAAFWGEGAFQQLPADLHYVPLVTGHLFCQVHKSSPLAHYHSVSIKEVFKYPLVVYQPPYTSTPPIILLLNHFGQPQQLQIERNLFLYQEKLRTGLGVGIYTQMPPYRLKNYVDGMIHVALKETIRVTLGYVTRKDAKLSPTGALVLQKILECI